MAGADWTLFHWLNGQAGQHAWLDQLGKTAATQLTLVIVVTLVGGWLLVAGGHFWRERQLPRGLLTVVFAAGISFALGLVANQVIGHVWFRARPYASHPRAHLLLSPSQDPSFPSDHATAGFALSLGAVTKVPRLAALLFMETVLMSAGRVYAGLHYPGDILGGLLVAAIAATAGVWVVGRAGSIVDRAVIFVNGYAQRWGWPVRLS